MESGAYNEGKQFALQHGTLYRNPYPAGSATHNDFERGWSQAHKRFPQAIAQADRKRESQNAAEREEQAVRRRRARDSYSRAKKDE
ncbi:hypothetical protein KBTX_02916 [wastewater metagenome]|uniref:Uncharacterized protein n=2 Tax=unclassified sequences TaxID=12908 RepID=A0A5B8RDB1_9ZZZZ|nr:hypothetical protein [Arhodomonas sp. KWT]QEA06576.1 hypothetical protein KBTEX_02916 [uncultured organism]